jgi:molecular chaperone HtpG
VTPVLEVNVDHPLFARLAAADDAALGEWAELLFDEALLAEGGTLTDPAGFVKRVNRLLLGTS